MHCRPLIAQCTLGKAIYGPKATFGGEAIDITAVLVKYTYHGDADFNGQVNFDDYSLIDLAFNTQDAPLDAITLATVLAQGKPAGRRV